MKQDVINASNRAMQQELIDANSKVDQVRSLLANYVKNSGCINMSMCDFRDYFAKIYNPNAPEFHWHFSTLARTAISEDSRRGRTPYPIGGTLHADYNVMVGDPIILPGKAVFQDTKESLRRALAREIIEERHRTLVQERSADTPISQSLQDKNVSTEDSSLKNTFVKHVSFIEKGKEPYLRPHPCFSPPHTHDAYSRHVEFVEKAGRARRNSGTPPGSPPRSPSSPYSRSGIDRSQTEAGRARSQRDHSRRLSSTIPSHKRDSRTERAKSPPIRTSLHDHQNSSSLKRREVDCSQQRSDSLSSQDQIRAKRARESRQLSDDSSSNLSSDVLNEPLELIPQPQVNFVAKIKQRYKFQEKAKSRCLETYSRGARRL